MTLPIEQSGDALAVVPLVGNEQTDEARWIGGLLSKLLAEHLIGGGLPALEYRRVALQITNGKHRLPLDEEGIQALRRSLDLQAVIHGRYVLDEGAKMLGLSLIVEAPGIPRVPLEASAPLSGFGRFIERISLALVDRLGVPINDALRQRIRAVPRPASFEAFRQLARAYLAWSRGENELALTAVTSALSLDPDLEEAAAIEAAIARAAGDTATAREAFRRWAGIAVRKQRPLVAAERLMLLGHWLMERGEWTEARSIYEDARDLFQREKDSRGRAQALNNLAHLDLLRGRVQAAIKTYRRSLRTFEEAPDAQEDVALTFYNLALAHKKLGQQAEARQAIEQALTLARRLKDTFLEACCLAQQGAIYNDMGQWARASASYTQAARLLDVVGREMYLAMVKEHQALLYRQQGMYERAETLLLEALEVFEQGEMPYQRAILQANLADLYLAMGLYDQAWQYARQAEETFEQLQSDEAASVKELLKTLEELPPQEPQEPPVEEGLFTISGPLPQGPGGGEPGNSGEGLYNGGEIYDNEGDDPVGRGGDVDENSGVGRTPMM